MLGYALTNISHHICMQTSDNRMPFVKIATFMHSNFGNQSILKKLNRNKITTFKQSNYVDAQISFFKKKRRFDSDCLLHSAIMWCVYGQFLGTM